MTLHRDSFFIGGEWVAPRSSQRITVIDATTEEVLGSAPEGQDADVDAAVAAARRAFDDPTGWSTWAPEQRARVMRRLADALDDRKDELTRLVCRENGMPMALAQMLEGALPSLLLRYYADLVCQTPVEEVRDGMFGRPVVVRREAIGVAAAIVPWNAPQTLASGKHAPALAAGATLVLKPSPETALDSYLFAEAAMEAGVPAGVINIVPADREVGAYLVGTPASTRWPSPGPAPPAAGSPKPAAACCDR